MTYRSISTILTSFKKFFTSPLLPLSCQPLLSNFYKLVSPVRKSTDSFCHAEHSFAAPPGIGLLVLINKSSFQLKNYLYKNLDIMHQKVSFLSQAMIETMLRQFLPPPISSSSRQRRHHIISCDTPNPKRPSLKVTIRQTASNTNPNFIMIFILRFFYLNRDRSQRVCN